VFLVFDARCIQCGNLFKAEADTMSEPAGGEEYRYTCPRCYTPATVSAGVARLREKSLPWAVRAALVSPGRRGWTDSPNAQ